MRSIQTDRSERDDESQPIDVGLSRRGLLAGRVVMAPCYFVLVLYLGLAATGEIAFDLPGVVMVSVSLFMSLTLLLPLSIGRWPRFVVRIYGRRLLLRTLEQAREGLGRKRPIRAKLREPDTWLLDVRVQ